MNPELKAKADETYRKLTKALVIMQTMDKGFAKLVRDLKKPKIHRRSR